MPRGAPLDRAEPLCKSVYSGSQNHSGSLEIHLYPKHPTCRTLGGLRTLMMPPQSPPQFWIASLFGTSILVTPNPPEEAGPGMSMSTHLSMRKRKFQGHRLAAPLYRPKLHTDTYWTGKGWTPARQALWPVQGHLFSEGWGPLSHHPTNLQNELWEDFTCGCLLKRATYLKRKITCLPCGPA